MLRNRYLYFLLILFAFSLPLNAFLFAAQPLNLENGRQYYNLGFHVDILEDPAGKWTINDMVSERIASLFQPLGKKSLAVGHTSSAYWVRFTLIQDPHSARSWMIKQNYPVMDFVDLYLPKPDGGYEIKSSGDKYPFRLREIDHPDIVFSTPVSRHQENTYYLRFQTGGAMNISLELLTPRSFIQENTKELLITGIYYGILLALLLYNLFIYFSVQDRSYLFYVIYMAAMLLYQSVARGIAYQYLWPGSPEWTDHSLILSLCLSVIFLLQFIRSFIRLPSINVLADKITIALMALFAIAMVLIFFVPYTLVMNGVNFLILLVIINIAALFALGLKKGFQPIRFLVIAFSALIMGTALKIFKDIGLLPYLFLTEYGTQIGTAFEAIILSFALANRINILQQEKRAAQAEILAANQNLVQSQRQAIENLKKSDSLKNEFVANVSHELGTPLHHIISYAQIGLTKLEISKAKTRECLEKIASSSNRLMILINNLIDLSKFEVGNVEYAFTRNDVFSIINENITGFSQQIEEKNLSIEMNQPTVSTDIVCNRAAISQVVQNLISNAIKYSPKRRTISISFESRATSLYVAISDEGPGIPNNELDAIFDKFIQSSKTKTGAGGTGLGLAISREIIKAHEGKIWAESFPGGGSRFCFMLPYQQKR